ncbi:hypothetical protein QCA50_001178 [Cerrena zonata]|uniref:Autophagy-related protein 13 n=1 Tax=Cerrena zonata TaxID=2478898 RepID=A0AAW0H0I4_9APHY
MSDVRFISRMMCSNHLSSIEVNIGKWILRNLFYNFIKEQQRTANRRNRELASQDSNHRIQRGSAPTHIDIDPHNAALRRRSSSDASRTSPKTSTHSSPKSPTVVTSPKLVPAASPNVNITGTNLTSTPNLTAAALSPIPQSPSASNDATPMPRAIQRSSTTDGNNIPATSPSAVVGHNDYFSLRGRRPSVGQVTTPDDFGGWSGPGSQKSGGIAVNTQATSPSPEIPQTPSTPSGHGLMGRLRAFGKVAKRQASEIGTASTTSGAAGSEANAPTGDDSTTILPKTPLQVMLSHPLTPPTSADAPPISLPSHTSVIISQESASGWTTLYQSFVSGTGRDANTLGEAMPMWLLEYLLTNKVQPIPVTKVSFVLLPYPGKEGAETLPELLNTSQSKLTASRFLRVRKLTHHVQDKLDKIMGGLASAVSTPRSSFDIRSPSRNDGRPRPEESFEILCNDMVLPLDMTLAAVRQFVWRSSGELVMHYRRRVMTGGAV